MKQDTLRNIMIGSTCLFFVWCIAVVIDGVYLNPPKDNVQESQQIDHTKLIKFKDLVRGNLYAHCSTDDCLFIEVLDFNDDYAMLTAWVRNYEAMDLILTKQEFDSLNWIYLGKKL